MTNLIRPATVALTLAASLASWGATSVPAPWRTSHFENVLGTSLQLRLRAASPAAASRAEAAVLAEIARLNGILSGYDPASEFSRWAATRDQALRVSPELIEVLGLWDLWRKRSGGVLTPSAEALTRVWSAAARAGRLPAPSELRPPSSRSVISGASTSKPASRPG